MKQEFINPKDIPNSFQMRVRTVYIESDNHKYIEAVRLQFPKMIQEADGIYLGRRNRFMVELDITTKCNLSCPNCVRFSHIPKSWVQMEMRDIYQFIKENLHYGKRLTVKIIGGEPTIHPNIYQIILELTKHFHVMLSTNGINQFVSPVKIHIEDSSKEIGVEPDFYATCDAPIDGDIDHGDSYKFGCEIAEICGSGRTIDGYYPCTTAGSIDRMLREPGGPLEGNEPLGKVSLKQANEYKNKTKVFDTLCRYCGSFDRKSKPRVTEQVWSKSWRFLDGNK